MERKLKFVKIPNALLGGMVRNGATPDELRVYYTVKMYELKWYGGSKVTVDIIDQEIPNLLQKTSAKNKPAIREALLSIKEKGFIYFKQEDLFRYNDLLEITYDDPDKNFTIVDLEWFEKITDNEQFAIQCLVLKNEGLQRPQFSYAEIADAIHLKTDRTIKNKLDEMELQGYISIIDNGLYTTENGEVRRHMKTFESMPVEDLDHFVGHKNYVESDSQKDDMEVDAENEDNDALNIEEQLPDDIGNWYTRRNGGKYANLTYVDYRLYMDNKDDYPVFARHCEERIKKIKKAKPDFFVDWNRRYKEKLKREEKEYEQNFGMDSDEQADISVEDDAEHFERPYKYKKREHQGVDISTFD